jgi:hypothetical protein
MTTTLLTLALAVLGAGETTPAKTSPNRERPKVSPYAPSLPYLSREEEDKLDQVIDRFMLYDIGTLRGAEGAAALREFKSLGPEAIPALVRGINRAARLQESCPVVVIAEKLQRMLLASDDPELLEFARDNIGSDVGPTRHAGTLQDLRFRVMIRKNQLARRPAGKAPGPKSPRAMTTTELADAASSERGPRLRSLLTELETRRGKEVVDGLTVAARSYERDTRKLGRDLLERHLARQPADFVKEKLTDEQAEVRRAAVRVVAFRHPRLAGDVIDLLTDEDEAVRTAAHETLVRLGRGQDFGPAADADKDQRLDAQRKWRTWWDRRLR